MNFYGAFTAVRETGIFFFIRFRIPELISTFSIKLHLKGRKKESLRSILTCQVSM